jgi:hypothetical protein
MNQELHFKTHIPSKNLFQNWLPLDNLNKFGHHLTIPRYWLKMPANPFMVIEIHSHHLMATEFNWCRCMATKFNCHATMATENLLVAKPMWRLKIFWSPSPCGDWKVFDYHNVLSLLPPLVFCPLLRLPPLMMIETLLVTILCGPLIEKWGY